MGKSIGIVGGGVGGMVAALLLRKKGCRVALYEKNSELGGRLAYHRHGDLQIDQGPTIVLLPEMLLSILEECGIERQQLSLVLSDPLAVIHFADGTSLRKYHDTEKQVAEIERFSPGEGANFLRYMNDLGNMFRQSKPLFLERIFLQKRSLFSWRNLMGLWRAKAHWSVRSLAAKYFRDERLRHAFSLQTLYIGGAPAQSPGLYSLIPYAEQAFGIWYLRGGYASLADLLASKLQASGVDVHTGAEVEQLWLEHDHCRGVIVRGKKIEHDAVIYNGDYPLINGLLGRAKKTEKRTFRPSSACLLFYIGLRGEWPQLDAHQFYLPADFDDQLQTLFRHGAIPERPSFYVFKPQALDDSAVPPGKTMLYVLVPVPSGGQVDWNEYSSPLRDYVFERLERSGLSGLRAAVEWLDVRTPEDARAAGLYGGGSFGLAPTWSQSGMFRPQVVPLPMTGLYAVGASVHPGGGIPIVMQGAKLLSQQIAKEMGL
jgi:phytoene desaturase